MTRRASGYAAQEIGQGGDQPGKAHACGQAANSEQEGGVLRQPQEGPRGRLPGPGAEAHRVHSTGDDGDAMRGEPVIALGHAAHAVTQGNDDVAVAEGAILREMGHLLIEREIEGPQGILHRAGSKRDRIAQEKFHFAAHGRMEGVHLRKAAGGGERGDGAPRPRAVVVDHIVVRAGLEQMCDGAGKTLKLGGDTGEQIGLVYRVAHDAHALAALLQEERGLANPVTRVTEWPRPASARLIS